MQPPLSTKIIEVEHFFFNFKNSNLKLKYSFIKRENYLFSCECGRCVSELSTQEDVTSDEDLEEDEDSEYEDVDDDEDEEEMEN